MSIKVSPAKSQARDAVCKASYNRSGDPTHDENRADADWQGGYLYGCFTPNTSSIDIREEWKRRGFPKEGTCRQFKSWKAGYWAGRASR